MTLREQHEIAVPADFLGDYQERCAIDRGDGPLTDEVRERAFRETMQKVERWRKSK